MKWFSILTIGFSGVVLGGVAMFAFLKANPSFLQTPREVTKLSQQDKNAISEEQVFDDIFEKHEDIKKQFDSLLNDDFFGQSNPFEEMRKMRERMQKQMEDLQDDSYLSDNPFDDWFSGRFGGGSINDIVQREDANYIYYDIEVENLDGSSIKAKAEDGYVTITGEHVSKSSEDDEIIHQMRSTFQRSFPLPSNVDGDQMQIETNENKIVIKFPKLDSV